MDVDITQGIAILERTPGTLHAMSHDLGTAWIDATEGPETWSPYGAAWRLTDTELALTGHGEAGPGRNRAVARVLAHRGPMKWQLS